MCDWLNWHLCWECWETPVPADESKLCLHLWRMERSVHPLMLWRMCSHTNMQQHVCRNLTHLRHKSEFMHTIAEGHVPQIGQAELAGIAHKHFSLMSDELLNQNLIHLYSTGVNKHHWMNTQQNSPRLLHGNNTSALLLLYLVVFHFFFCSQPYRTISWQFFPPYFLVILFPSGHLHNGAEDAQDTKLICIII